MLVESIVAVVTLANVRLVIRIRSHQDSTSLMFVFDIFFGMVKLNVVPVEMKATNVLLPIPISCQALPSQNSKAMSGESVTVNFASEIVGASSAVSVTSAPALLKAAGASR
jgi:hypothetical protein